MEARLRSWWQIIKQHPYVTGFVVVLMLILFILIAYRFGWDWTGFNSGTNQITITSTSKGNYTATTSQPSKSLWDWLQLLGVLAIPIVVGFGVAWYTAQQGKVSAAENTDNQLETALQAYIDKMSELLLEKKLYESEPQDEVRTIARAQTLTVLSTLNANRKASLLQFLYEARLIKKDERDGILDLSKADLSKANLKGANLSYTVLFDTDMRESDLGEADLSDAILFSADLRGAILKGADLSYANLRGAKVASEQLKKAKSLKGATMPDGSIHP